MARYGDVYAMHATNATSSSLRRQVVWLHVRYPNDDGGGSAFVRSFVINTRIIIDTFNCPVVFAECVRLRSRYDCAAARIRIGCEPTPTHTHTHTRIVVCHFFRSAKARALLRNVATLNRAGCCSRNAIHPSLPTAVANRHRRRSSAAT